MAENTINVEDAIAITPDFFGPLLSYVEDEDVTDIDYNGTDTWIRTCHGLRYRADELKDKMTKQFVTRLTSRIQTSVSKEFNPQHPLLEAETKVLRISIVHESVCNGRRSICIRKTPTSVRIDTRSSVESGYASPELLSFLRNAVKAHFNLTICGEPGVGKTEFAKYVSMQIPEKERVITIEDNLEWHYHELKPTADCVEMQVSPQFDYYMAIKACLRQNPNWIMISEVRGKEVANYLQQLSTGVHGITTVHTGDVGDVPDRLCNMAADVASRGRIEGDIYTFLDIAVLVDMVVDDDGLSKRRVSQVGMFFNENGEKKLLRIFDNGQLVCPNLPIQTLARFEKAKIENPFINDDIIAQCDGLDLSSLEPLMNISSHVDPELLRAHAAQQAALAQQTTMNAMNNMPVNGMSMNNMTMNGMMPNMMMQGQVQYQPQTQVQAAQNESSKSLSSKAIDKRKTKRYDIDGEIMVKLGDNSFEKVVVKNVSSGGIGILSKHPLNQNPSNFMMLASFEHTGLEKPIMLELKAVRSVDSDYGIYYGCRITRTGSGWQEYISNISSMKS
jgi:pilus assembly protein CpaF